MRRQTRTDAADTTCRCPVEWCRRVHKLSCPRGCVRPYNPSFPTAYWVGWRSERAPKGAHGMCLVCGYDWWFDPATTEWS